MKIAQRKTFTITLESEHEVLTLLTLVNAGAYYADITYAARDMADSIRREFATLNGGS